MRKIAGLLGVAALAASAAPAGAVPSNSNGLITETLHCVGLGDVDITHGSGSNGWAFDLGNTHFVVASFSSGEFTKTFGQKNGMSGLVTCTTDDGVTVTAYPGPQGG
jgi:hypothetical protein